MDHLKLLIYGNANRRCEVCGKLIKNVWDGHLAHIIPQSKMYKAKYGEEIIHHPFNMAYTCPEHNSRVMISQRPLLQNWLINEIWKSGEVDRLENWLPKRPEIIDHILTEKGIRGEESA